MPVDFYILVAIAEDLRGKNGKSFFPCAFDFCNTLSLIENDPDRHIVTSLFQPDFPVMEAVCIITQFIHGKHGVFDPTHNNLDISGECLRRLE